MELHAVVIRDGLIPLKIKQYKTEVMNVPRKYPIVIINVTAWPRNEDYKILLYSGWK